MLAANLPTVPIYLERPITVPGHLLTLYHWPYNVPSHTVLD